MLGAVIVEFRSLVEIQRGDLCRRRRGFGQPFLHSSVPLSPSAGGPCVGSRATHL